VAADEAPKYGIELGPERLDFASFGPYRPSDDGLWLIQVPYREYQVEVLMAGGEKGPDPQWRSLAEGVCVHIELFVTEGTQYLRAFIGNHPLFNGEWSLEGLEFGRDAHERRHKPFELMFSLDRDVFGMWGVLFTEVHGLSGYIPCQFRRYQC